MKDHIDRGLRFGKCVGMDQEALGIISFYVIS